MQNLLQDLRYSLRLLRTQRALSLVAILALALGIGANTAIFSVINSVLLRPLPLPSAERLVIIWGNFLKINIAHLPAKTAEYVDYRDETKSFAQVAAFNNAELVLTGAGEPKRIPAARVTANLLPLVGAQAIYGRLIASDDNQLGREHIVVLSHDFWQRQFGGQPDAIGQTMMLDGQSHTIVGIAQPGFAFPHESFPFAQPVEIWTPIAFDPAQIAQRAGRYSLNVIAQLRTGVTLEQARAEMSGLAKRFEEENRGYRGPGGADGGWRITVESLQDQIVGGSRSALWILFGAVGFVLLIACANVANLLLMRATVRQKELAVRAALGASRARLVRQLLVESLLLAVLGGVLGLLLAWWGVDLLRALSPENLPRVQEIRLDGRVLAFTVLLAVLTGLLFGLAPAWQASQPDLQKSLKEGAAATRGRHWLRSLLVVSEVTLAVLLLVGAGLLLHSFIRLQRVKPGVTTDKVLTASLSLPATKYQQPTQIAAFYEQLAQRIEALPGVEAVSVGTLVPLSGAAVNDPFSVEGRALDMSNPPVAGWQRVGPNFFRTLGISIVRGRDFTARDNLDAPNVAIINEAMARRYFPNEDPIGKRLTPGLPRPDNPWAEIVGIVKDIPHRAVGSAAEPDWYLPYLREPRRDLHLFVRTTGDPASFAEAVRHQVLALDKDQPLTTIKTLDDVIKATVAPRRFNTLLLGLFAAIALLLAALGIYSVISYSVAQRTQEIGIRMALGAQRSDVWRLVVRQGMTLVMIGIAIGLSAALALTRLMKNLLYEVSATDPLTFALIALLLIGVALLACYVPARRAMKVDPLQALRHD
jgi:putative ABC transport system permease protein